MTTGINDDSVLVRGLWIKRIVDRWGNLLWRIDAQLALWNGTKQIIKIKENFMTNFVSQEYVKANKVNSHFMISGFVMG